MTPVEQSPRHYVGPEQPKAPPTPSVPDPSMPTEERPALVGAGRDWPFLDHLKRRADAMPPAEELIDDGPPTTIPDMRSPVGVAFESWFEQTKDGSPKPEDFDRIGGLLEEAFLAGWQAAMAAPVDIRDLPLEGTVESRTIVAALEMFKEQVLVHQPEEVKSGEWLNARDVEVLIQGIRANAAKGR